MCPWKSWVSLYLLYRERLLYTCSIFQQGSSKCFQYNIEALSTQVDKNTYRFKVKSSKEKKKVKEDFSLSLSHLHVFIHVLTYHMLRLPEEERTTVCDTAGKDHRTWGADAQVTSVPGELAITPSRLKVYWATFCKTVISHFTTSALWCLISLAFVGFLQCTCASVHENQLSHHSNEASVSSDATWLPHISGCSFALHILSLCSPHYMLPCGISPGR